LGRHLNSKPREYQPWLWRHPDVFRFNIKMIKQLTSSIYFIVRQHVSVLMWPSSGLLANQVNKYWLHVGIPTMFTISTSILYVADKYIKFYPLNFIYLSARYNILVLTVNIVRIPTCNQHLLTWFARRPDDGHIRTETCSLTHNKILCVWRKLFNNFNTVWVSFT
jgi:hypothetical protein